jgi:hypothetical protein
MRDGHEPNEAEEQRPCCVPIEPVHVISSPKDRREQEGYQNSGSFGEKSWGDFADINPLSFAREAIVAKHGHALPYRMAIITGLAIHQHHRRAFSILRHLPDRENTQYPLEQRFNLCERSRSSCHFLALKHPSRSWCLDCFLPIPDGINHRKHQRRYFTWITVLLLRAARGRDRRARFPASRGGRRPS